VQFLFVVFCDAIHQRVAEPVQKISFGHYALSRQLPQLCGSVRQGCARFAVN